MTRATKRRRSNAGVRAEIILIAVAWWAIAAAGPAAAAQTVTADGNGNGVTDTWGIDDNNDGQLDRLLIDGDENGVAEVWATTSGGRFISIWLDTSLDNVYDSVLVPYYATGTSSLSQRVLWRDGDQNGLWESAYYDGQMDAYYEWVLVDTNFDGTGDTWQGNVAPAGYGAADEAARRVAALGAFQILVAGNVPIFGPLAWPVGG